jgi:hypothetical protein
MATVRQAKSPDEWAQRTELSLKPPHHRNVCRFMMTTATAVNPMTTEPLSCPQ